jgi:hypothetical protein
MRSMTESGFHQTHGQVLHFARRIRAAGFWVWIVPCLVLCLITGCTSPKKRVARQMKQLRHEWETNMLAQANLPERVLDWSSAVNLMLGHNLKLLQARTEMTNAEESVRQVFKDLIPTVNLRAGLSKRIADFGNIAANDVTLSADSFFNVPGVVGFNARLYAARLYQLRTTAAYQLAVREQMVDLYRLFYSAQELGEQKRRLEMERAAGTAMAQVDPFTGHVQLTELETRDLSHEREVKTFQDSAADLLGTREARWVFSTNGLPDLHYEKNPLPLTDTNRVAQLQMKLLAVELESARAQLMGLKLQYWPELNIFVSGPPVYQRIFGTDRFWDADQVQASADLFWNIDTRGNLARSIRQTKRQQDLQKERYRQESLTLMNRLLFTQKIIDGVEKQLTRVENQLAVLLAIPVAQNYAALEKYSMDYRNLTEQQLQLRRDLSELNALFWFVDEDAWTNQEALFPKT